MFSSGTAKAVLKNGSAVSLTDPNSPLHMQDSPVDRLQISDEFSLYEVDSIARLSAWCGALSRKDSARIRRIIFHLPDIEYMLYLADAYNRKMPDGSRMVSAKIMSEWMQTTSVRRDKLKNAFNTLINAKSNKLAEEIMFIRPLEEIEGYLKKVIENDQDIDFNCIINSYLVDRYWQFALSQNPPRKDPENNKGTMFQQLSYLSYTLPALIYCSEQFNSPKQQPTGGVLVYNLVEAKLYEELLAYKNTGLNTVFVGLADFLMSDDPSNPLATVYRAELPVAAARSYFPFAAAASGHDLHTFNRALLPMLLNLNNTLARSSPNPKPPPLPAQQAPSPPLADS